MTTIRRKMPVAANENASEPGGAMHLAPTRLRTPWLSGWSLLWLVPAAGLLAALLVFAFDPPGDKPGKTNPTIAETPASEGPTSTGSFSRAAPSPSGRGVGEGAQPRRSSALQSPALAPPEPGTVERTGDQPAFPESRAPVANAAAPARPAAEQSRVAALPPNAEPRPEQAAPDPAAAARPRPGSPALTLSSEEIATHLARGEERLKAGELAAARLYFERVALAGDARGALGMARTYDPAVLARLPVLGPRADPAAAKAWYERAASQRAGG